MSALKGIAAFALSLAPFAIQRTIFPTTTSLTPLEAAVTMAVLSLSTFIAGVYALCLIAAHTTQGANAMFMAAWLLPWRLRRQEALQAAIDCDAGMRSEAPAHRVASILTADDGDLGRALGVLPSDDTKAAVQNAFRGWIGRHMGAITVTLSPLPPSATLAAAELSRAKARLTRLQSRANGPSSPEDRTRES